AAAQKANLFVCNRFGLVIYTDDCLLTGSSHRAGELGACGGKFWPARHSWSLASRLAFDSALKSGNASCAAFEHLSIAFHLACAPTPCELACTTPGAKTISIESKKGPAERIMVSPSLSKDIIARS